MNLKIQQTYPLPSLGLSDFNSLVYAPNINSLILYGEQKHNQPTKPEQPKKKIAFKANKTDTAPLIDKVSVFSLRTWQWTIQQCKGKMPSSRSDFKTLWMGSCMILYGGRSGDKLHNDIFALNSENWTWKKLFTLEGPPTSSQSLFCKLTQTIACLVFPGQLWFLHIQDVKWQLASNQLPGSMWEQINTQIPDNLRCCCLFSSEELLVAGLKESIVINWKSKQTVSRYKKDLSQYFTQNKKAYFSCILSPHIFLLISDTISIFEIQSDSFEDLQQSNIQLPKLHCLTLVDNSPSLTLYIMDPKGQLYSINFPQELNGRDQDERFPETTKIIESPEQIRNQVITEEDDGQGDSSLLLDNCSRVHDSSNLQQMPSRSSKNCIELIQSDNKKAESDVVMDEYQQYSPRQPKESREVKDKLEVILTHEYLKRRLLEQKISAFEDIIKKSQKFVLLLCKYGDFEAKKKHIEEVKYLRQELQYHVSKQNYYRQQIQGNNINLNRLTRKVDKMLQNLLQ